MIKQSLALVAFAILLSGCFERLVLIGDSTTACFARFNPAVSANALLDPAEYEVVNRAIPTLTSAAWANDHWTDDVLALYPNATAIITIGVNDWIIGLTPQESVANIVQIAGRFQKSYVTGLHHVDPTGTLEGHENWLAWRAILQAELEAQGITAWDYPPFEKEDGLHHSSAGCQELGTRIGQEILNQEQG
jgi:lysophospholipase L1-like esterase